MNKLVKNYIYNLIYQIFVIIVPIITAPYLARTLGPAKLGIYSYLNSTTTIISTVSLLGIYTYGNRQIAYFRDNEVNINENFWEIMISRLLLGIFGTIIYFIWGYFSKYFKYYILYYPFILANFIDCSWLFVGMEDMKPAVIKNFFAKLASVIGIFLFIKNSSDLYIYILILSISTFIANLSVYFQIKKYVSKPKIHITLKKINTHIKGSLILFLPQVASLIYLQIGKVMIEWITNDAANLSYYDQAEKIITIPLTIITVLNTVIMPRIANEFKNGKKKKIEQLLINTAKFTMFLACPLMIGIMSLADKFIPWYLGNDFLACITIIYILAPMIITNSLVGISGTQYFTATNQINILVKSYSIAAILNIVLNIIFISLYSFVGAAISTVISSLILTIIQYYYLNKQIIISPILYESKKYLIFSIVMGIVIYFVSKNMLATPVTTIIQIVIGVFVYFTLIILSKDKTFKQLLSFLISNKKNNGNKK
ncbi:flippase [Thomasclavelia saccharogumia]|uniref:flippase n=1 Tax=Thomasclavelia saccharogumia TaxID=341225 RepID=UPI00047ACC2D|nr:flippase [Thomasclavelia saccharogumia]